MSQRGDAETGLEGSEEGAVMGREETKARCFPCTASLKCMCPHPPLWESPKALVALPPSTASSFTPASVNGSAHFPDSWVGMEV